MPRVNIYIRNEDFEKWKLVENKSELISQAINRSEISPVKQPSGELVLNHQIKPPVIPKHTDLIANATPIFTRIAECPNGHGLQPGRTRCSAKGCKYN